VTASSTPNAAQAAPMLQPIAIARSYEALRAGIAAWCKAERISRMELDARAGLTDGHAGKILSPRAVKKLGRQTFGAVLNGAGLALVLVRDDETLALIEQLLAASSPQAIPRQHWRQIKGTAWGRRMAGRRTLKLTRQRRSEIAKHAAQARWHPQQTTSPIDTSNQPEQPA
jgi:hypothetical protein